jgi:hypothetical protein
MTSLPDEERLEASMRCPQRRWERDSETPALHTPENTHRRRCRTNASLRTTGAGDTAGGATGLLGKMLLKDSACEQLTSRLESAQLEKQRENHPRRVPSPSRQIRFGARSRCTRQPRRCPGRRLATDHTRMARLMLPLLAEAGFRALAIDPPGLGDSDILPQGDHADTGTVADIMSAALGNYGVRKFTLVGHVSGVGSVMPGLPAGP